MSAGDRVNQVFHYVTLTERIRASIGTATFLVSTFQDIADHDPTLGPELLAAVDAVTGATEALMRAEVFARTRLEVLRNEG